MWMTRIQKHFWIGHPSTLLLKVGIITSVNYSNKNPKNKCEQMPKTFAMENGHLGVGLLIDEMCNI
jgi:hypothetical protein